MLKEEYLSIETVDIKNLVECIVNGVSRIVLSHYQQQLTPKLITGIEANLNEYFRNLKECFKLPLSPVKLETDSKDQSSLVVDLYEVFKKFPRKQKRIIYDTLLELKIRSEKVKDDK